MWNYRIVGFKEKGRRGRFYKICEVYYTEKGEPWGCCNATPCGDTIKEMFEDFISMAGSMPKAYLKYEEFVERDFEIPTNNRTENAE